MSQEQPSIESLVKYCRCSIQLSLSFIVIMSGIAYLQIFEPDVGHIVQNFMLMLPIYILMSLFWLHKVKKKAGISRNTAAFKIVFNDELRLQTIYRSYREAFLY